MSRLIDLVGQKFGRLTVVERAGYNKKQPTWNCVCECGNPTVVQGGHLRAGEVKSCGCLISEGASARNKTHGLSCHPLYKVYSGMADRCYNTKSRDFQHWGARGIAICEEWLGKPEKFIEWSLANGWEPGLSIDRVDNNGPYSIDNCRWSTVTEQNRNRRNTVLVMYGGEKRPVSELIAASGLATSTVGNRIRRGWSWEDALNTPPGQPRSGLHVGVA